MKKIIFAFTFLLNSLFSSEIDKKYDNLSHELTTCSAYFSLTSQATTSDKEISQRFKSLFNMASNISLEYAKRANRTEKMAQKVVLSRYELELNSMIKEIDSNYSNFSILTNKYKDKCFNLLSNKKNDLILNKKNIGFVQNQKYVCINQGMLLNGKLEQTMTKEEALNYPIRFYVDDSNSLHTDAGLKLPLFKKKEQFYKNDEAGISLTVENEKRYMLFMHKALSYVPALYLCEETDNWTLKR